MAALSVPILDADAPADAGRPCGGCAHSSLDFDFDYAYQAIVDLRTGTLFGHEALVRGPQGEPAMSVLSRVTEANRYAFDQACRVRAIEGAAQAGLTGVLSINFLPNAIYEPARCLGTTLATARRTGFPLQRLMFEVTEGERVADAPWLMEIMREYKRTGLITAIDDFGAGHSGLNLLADFQPDLVKLDMGLVRHLHTDRARAVIVTHLARMCEQLGIQVIAEGVETAEERDALLDAGIHLMQGYLFARPAFRSAGEVAWSRVAGGRRA